MAALGLRGSVLRSSYSRVKLRRSVDQRDPSDVYKGVDLGLDLPAIIQYARENNIPLTSVSQEVIHQHTFKNDQLVG